jgi:DNA recombination protein RmuC
VIELLIAAAIVGGALVGYVLGLFVSRSRELAQQQRTGELTSKLAVTENELQHLRTQFESKEQEIETLNHRLVLEFKNIAQEIVESKGKLLNEESQKNIGALLTPLKEKIESFEAKVSQSHLDAMKDNSALRQQLEQLSQLNQSIGKEAQNLVNALKGNVKTQGNWGEMILEKILEKSGLERDRE